MRQIKSVIKQSMIHNTWNDFQAESNGSETIFRLNSEGLCDEHEIEHIVLLDCSHDCRVFSLCGVCAMQLCQDCSTQCCRCHRPLGTGCHAEEVEGKWYCPKCRGDLRRRSFLRSLLSPLIEFEKDI